MKNHCETISGTYISLGDSKLAGGIVRSDHITIGDVTLKNISLSSDALNLIALGDKVIISYFTDKKITYIAYIKFESGAITKTPEFASKSAVSTGVKSLGLLILVYFSFIFLNPNIIAIMNEYEINSILIIVLAFVAPTLSFISFRARILNCKKIINTITMEEPSIT